MYWELRRNVTGVDSSNFDRIYMIYGMLLMNNFVKIKLEME